MMESQVTDDEVTSPDDAQQDLDVQQASDAHQELTPDDARSMAAELAAHFGSPLPVEDEAEAPAAEEAAADETVEVAADETVEVAADEPVEVAADDAAVAEAAVDEAADAETDDAGDDTDGDADADAEAAAEVKPPSSPYDLPGSWFVVHSYSGYENKVKANLETRIKSMHMEDRIFDVVIPMEEVVEFKAGRKVNVMRKQFPGYILTRMYLDDDSWFTVRNTPGVTGFVGSASKPTPLSRREVERILGVRKEEEEKKTPRFKPEWEVGETVRVVEGPFADFNGLIEDINVDQSKVRVLVDIFGRETPVELNFDQIQKY